MQLDPLGSMNRTDDAPCDVSGRAEGQLKCKNAARRSPFSGYGGFEQIKIPRVPVYVLI